MTFASLRTVALASTIATAAAIVISRNEILTALEDENDSEHPGGTFAYAQATITPRTIFLPRCNIFHPPSLSPPPL